MKRAELPPMATGKPRRLSGVVHDLDRYPECEPLRDMYLEAAAEPRRPGRRSRDLLSCHERLRYDRRRWRGISGSSTKRQGRLLQDLLALILGTCRGMSCTAPGSGLIFTTHNLDVTYPAPALGEVEFLLEAKAVGTPKHPRSERAGPLGRAGHKDLDKRVKESAFKVIDLKGEYARRQTHQGHSPTAGVGGDLTTYLPANLPTSFLFFCNGGCVRRPTTSGCWSSPGWQRRCMIGSGLIADQPVAPDQPTTYRGRAVAHNALALDRVLFQACQQLTSIRRRWAHQWRAVLRESSAVLAAPHAADLIGEAPSPFVRSRPSTESTTSSSCPASRSRYALRRSAHSSASKSLQERRARDGQTIRLLRLQLQDPPP